MTKLFGVNIAKEISKGMGRGLLSGTLIKVSSGNRTTGSLTAGTNPSDKKHVFRGIVEDYSLSQINGTTVQTGDRKILILGGSLSSGILPESGDRIDIENLEDLNVVRVERDPAAAVYTCQVRG